MKKSIFWTVTAILVVICIFLFFKSCSNDKSLKNDLSKQQDSLIAAKQLSDSLRKAYNECAGIMTPEERIAFLESKVSDLEKRKPIVRCRVVRPKSFRKFVPTRFTSPLQKKLDVSEKKFEPTFSPKPVSRAVETPKENNLLVAQYQGVMTGDYGTTIDNGSGKIVYFLRNSFVKSNGGDEVPHLNGRNGEKFSYNPRTGYWFYVDGQVMTVGEVNSWAYAREWNVYIGQTDYGVGSYETYLPHQALKPLINRARGKEWGEITDEDLYKMRKLNSSIWTPSSEGTLRPFRLNSTSGRAYGKEDKQLYQGWNFRTKIVVVKK